ncbi:MAG: hypothetical protein N2Z20_00710 [Elusimicrobiales bacterium]|nr:hypothetical protein [Elusimicrobiales bacterium]
MLGEIIFFALTILLNSQVIDPELQRYFEKNYGYLKDDSMRNAPVSISEALNPKLKNSLITYTIVPQPDYTEIPLHYDLKKQNTAGSISYYVSQPKETKYVPTYTGVDILVLKSKYSSALKLLTSLGFIMAGEEVNKDEPYVIIFGWIDDSNFNKVMHINGVERISVSTRILKAPPRKLLITVKVPNNRDITLFIDRFVSKLTEYGFEKENIEIVSADKKYRFSIIKIKGTVPLDKTKIILKSPFVIDIES